MLSSNQFVLAIFLGALAPFMPPSAALAGGPAKPAERLCVGGDHAEFSGLATLFLVDAASGDRSILSNDSVGSGPSLGHHVFGLDLLDADHVVALTRTFSDGTALFAVDLDTGDRQLISSESVGSGPVLPGVATAVVLGDDGQLYLTALGLREGIYRVDPDTGARAAVSTGSTGSGPALSSPIDMELESPGVLLVAETPGLSRVDTQTGARTSVSMKDYNSLDLFGGETYVIQGLGLNSVARYSEPLDVVLSNNTGVGAGETFDFLATLEVDFDGTILVLDTGKRAIFRVDGSGNRTVVSSEELGVGGGPSFFWSTSDLPFILPLPPAPPLAVPEWTSHE